MKLKAPPPGKGTWRHEQGATPRGPLIDCSVCFGTAFRPEAIHTLLRIHQNLDIISFTHLERARDGAHVVKSADTRDGYVAVAWGSIDSRRCHYAQIDKGAVFDCAHISLRYDLDVVDVPS